MAMITSGAPTKNPTFVGAVERADEEVRQLAIRVSQLATRLVGSIPAEAVMGEQDASEGVFPTVYSVAARTAGRAREAMEEIDRIERALP